MKNKILIIFFIILISGISYFFISKNDNLILNCTLNEKEVKKLNIFFHNKGYFGDKNYWCNIEKIQPIFLFTGKEIIPEIGKLINLKYLLLKDRGFIGKIPEELGNLKNLIVLGLHQNNLEGNIPKSFIKLKNLESLTISGNKKMTGFLPNFLFNLEKLDSLQIINTNIKIKNIPKNHIKLFDYDKNNIYIEKK